MVYGTVSASLSTDIQSRLSSAIAQTLIVLDEREEEFAMDGYEELPDYISMYIADEQGSILFSTEGDEWLQNASVDQ